MFLAERGNTTRQSFSCSLIVWINHRLSISFPTVQKYAHIQKKRADVLLISGQVTPVRGAGGAGGAGGAWVQVV